MKRTVLATILLASFFLSSRTNAVIALIFEFEAIQFAAQTSFTPATPIRRSSIAGLTVVG